MPHSLPEVANSEKYMCSLLDLLRSTVAANYEFVCIFDSTKCVSPLSAFLLRLHFEFFRPDVIYQFDCLRFKNRGKLTDASHTERLFKNQLTNKEPLCLSATNFHFRRSLVSCDFIFLAIVAVAYFRSSISIAECVLRQFEHLHNLPNKKNI